MIFCPNSNNNRSFHKYKRLYETIELDYTAIPEWQRDYITNPVKIYEQCIKCGHIKDESK